MRLDEQAIAVRDGVLAAFDEVLQWIGAVAIMAGHFLNRMPELHPFNIAAFTVGTITFLIWTIRVANKPQMVVNLVALALCVDGLYRAWG